MQAVQESLEQNLKKKLQEKTKQLVGISKDAHFAETLIEEILTLKAQLDVEATEFCVRSKDVLEEYDLDSVKFTICNNGIVFHAKSGYTTFIEPRCKALFGELLEIIREKKRINSLSDDEKSELDEEQIDAIEQTFAAWVHILEMPVASSISPIILFKVATEFLKVFNEETTRILETPLAAETAERLQEVADRKAQEEVLDAMAEHIKKAEEA